tara:strand:+ start:3017 stop:3211 length:195 start_codon:yes stop_codon:yes gene_type:complete
MSFDFDAGELDLDDIQSKALSEEQIKGITEAIQADLGTAETVGQVLSVLTKASAIALKLGLLAI